MDGLIHCYTGDGKGKTTAAVGLAVRAAGSGMRVLFTQFLKDGSSAEIGALREVPGIRVLCCPGHFGFYRALDDAGREKLRQAESAYFDSIVREIGKGQTDLLVMDEFAAAYRLNLFDREKALLFLRQKPEQLEIVLTGREMPPEVVDLADYVTEMRKVRHPYDRGITARKGIEY